MFNELGKEVQSFRMNDGKTRLRLIESWQRDSDVLLESQASFLPVDEKTTLEEILLRYQDKPFFGIPELRIIKKNPNLLPKEFWMQFRQGNHILYFLGSLFEDTETHEEYIPYLIESDKSFIMRFAKTNVYVGGCIPPAVPYYI